MPNVPTSDTNPQDRAVAIIRDALDVLRTRDGVIVSNAAIDERARNAVAALGSEFELVHLLAVVPAANDNGVA